MLMATVPTGPTPAHPSWQDELAAHVRSEVFPAGHDDLVAMLVRHRAPSHLLWRLSWLPPAKSYHSLQELVQAIEETGAHAVQTARAAIPT
jgi:hypothetical protein